MCLFAAIIRDLQHTALLASQTHYCMHNTQALSTYASLYARDRRVTPAAFHHRLPAKAPATEAQLRRAEEAYRVRCVCAPCTRE